MRSPVSTSPIGECNAITQTAYLPKRLDFPESLSPPASQFARSVRQVLRPFSPDGTRAVRFRPVH
jgi:hypothetical protein